MSEPHQIHSFICRQCAVWRDVESVTFHSIEAAEEHVFDKHTSRLLEAYRDTASLAADDDNGYGVREEKLHDMLRNCREENDGAR